MVVDMADAIFEFIGNVIGFVWQAIGTVLIIALICSAVTDMNDWGGGI